MGHDNDERVQQVIQAEKEWLKAHLYCDVALLAHLMADEYIQVTGKGGLANKAEVLGSFQSGTRHWDEAESDEYNMRVYGDIAVVYGRWRAKGVNTGDHFNYSSRYVSVWLYRDGRWQMVSDQSTEIAAE